MRRGNRLQEPWKLPPSNCYRSTSGVSCLTGTGAADSRQCHVRDSLSGPERYIIASVVLKLATSHSKCQTWTPASKFHAAGTAVPTTGSSHENANISVISHPLRFTHSLIAFGGQIWLQSGNIQTSSTFGGGCAGQTPKMRNLAKSIIWLHAAVHEALILL